MTAIACAAYLATVSLGLLSLRGRRVRRVWHTRFFVATLALTGLAAAIALLRAAIPEALALILALVPLGLLPALTAPVWKHPRRHAVLALCAAPCYATALALRLVEAA